MKLTFERVCVDPRSAVILVRIDVDAEREVAPVHVRLHSDDQVQALNNHVVIERHSELNVAGRPSTNWVVIVDSVAIRDHTPAQTSISRNFQSDTNVRVSRAAADRRNCPWRRNFPEINYRAISNAEISSVQRTRRKAAAIIRNLLSCSGGKCGDFAVGEGSVPNHKLIEHAGEPAADRA